MGVAASCCAARSDEESSPDDCKKVTPVVPPVRCPDVSYDHCGQRELPPQVPFTTKSSRHYLERLIAFAAIGLSFSFCIEEPVATIFAWTGSLQICVMLLGLGILSTSFALYAYMKHGVVPDESLPELLCEAEKFQVVPEAGIVSPDVWEGRACRSCDYILPLECAPLTLEQASLYISISRAVAGMTFADLRRDFGRSIWLKEPDCYSARFREVVSFDPRDIVRVILSVSACKPASSNAAETASQWLQQIYALRFDHAMDQPKLCLDITARELQLCRSIYPKAVYGLSRPHGYPIMWDMVSALRLDHLRDNFGTVEDALEKILWYDLQIMELFDRYKRRLSSSRDGVLLLKGISVLDLGAWCSDLLAPAILHAVIRIITRSGAIWPESVWRIYLVNVPWVFMGPWSVIKRACHPVTLQKLRIFSSQSEFFGHFEKELGVTLNDIPMEHGGSGPSLVDLPITPTAHLDESVQNKKMT